MKDEKSSRQMTQILSPLLNRQVFESGEALRMTKRLDTSVNYNMSSVGDEQSAL